ncbi:MAG: hypothetical protein Q4C47_00135 [Planctomycetia bacterium]|nr:hypothetical protein [Planctomycetia bacterium]
MVATDNIGAVLGRALEAGQGVLRLVPNWVPRSFLQPGRRIKLHPDDWYAYGADRGGIDERWFGSTTEAANEGRLPDEGLSYVIFEGERFLLKDAVSESGAQMIGAAMFDRYGRWPVYSKFFDNMGPIPHHMHQQFEHAKLVGQDGKPEAYYFSPQMNNVDNNFCYTFMGLEPGTTKEEIRRCIANWNVGDNGILDYSKAYRLKRGSGWLVPPGVLHAPGSLCTYEPQWGSDVFGMYQSIVEGRYVPWDLLVKDMPKEKHQDIDFIVDELDWERNVDPYFKEHNYLEPIVDPAQSGDSYWDRWICYGIVCGRQMISAKELTVMPGAKVTLHDAGASCWIFVQGSGRLGAQRVQMICFGEETFDEFFVTAEAAASGVTVENDGGEPLVALRYFGPDTHPNMPNVGDYRKQAGGCCCGCN